MLQFGKQLKRKSLLGKTSCHVSTEVIPPPVLNQGARRGRLSKMLQKSLQSGKRMFGESLFQKLLNLVVNITNKEITSCWKPTYFKNVRTGLALQDSSLLWFGVFCLWYVIQWCKTDVFTLKIYYVPWIILCTPRMLKRIGCVDVLGESEAEEHKSDSLLWLVIQFYWTSHENMC